MRNSIKPLLVLCAALLVTACATNNTYGAAPGSTLTELQQLPKPAVANQNVIGSQKLLLIEVLGSELLSGKYLTDVDGRIDFPLAGKLDLSGRTPIEAARIIENSLRGRYVLDPQVNVVPDEIEELTVSVGGQVEKPGSYPATPGLTLMRAMNLAGGQGEFADLDEVLIFRSVGGKRLYRDLQSRGDPAGQLFGPNNLSQ
ncbi:MAG: polysaccharide biosynthesis/export family protein [Marinomonas sp.]